MPDKSAGETLQAQAAKSRYATILAPVTGSARDKRVVETALGVAAPFHAHVECLFVHPDPRMAVPYMSEPLSPAIVDEIVRLAQEGVAVARGQAKATVTEAAAAAGVSMVARPTCKDAVTVSLREVAGDFSHRVAEAASLSDLVVFGPLSSHEWPDVREGFVEVLIQTGRPVLLAPQVCGPFERKIAVAWDGSMSAARALMASLPFLEHAAEIDVFHVAPEPARTGPPREVEDFFAGHGLAFAYRPIEQRGQTVGEALLAGAHSCAAELLVMGGYGHSHLREQILGGASQHVIWHATMPVLLTH